MHTRLLVATLLVATLLALSSPLALAQSPSRTVGPSTTLSSTPSSQANGNGYMIAPGVVVTPFYQDAPTQVPSYDPNATTTDYGSQAYQQAAVPSYTYNTGALTLPTTQTQIYQASYPMQEGGKTPYDNSQYRFDMQQNGKQMSAQDFDAWMKARGIRIAGGQR